MNIVAGLLSSLLILSSSRAGAEIIASQDFNTNIFSSVLELDSGSIATVVTHAGSGNSGTNLGFSANGRGSTTGGNNPQFQVVTGLVVFSHFSSGSAVSTSSSAESLTDAPLLTFAQGTDHTAFLYGQTVDLSRHNTSSFSIDVGDLVTATNTTDDDIVVRLWVNGSTEVVLVDTRGNANGNLSYGPITHNFADTDVSAQLLVDLFTDDDYDGYRIDNILFEGTADTNAPTFTTDPFSTTNARATVAYSDTIAGSATDPNSDPLTYSKLAGPAWLSVATNGVLSGTPLIGDMGLNDFTVMVDDGNGGTHAALLQIQVNDPEGNPPINEDTSATDQVRLVWLTDPSTTITIAWKQTSGSPATVYYGNEDFGRSHTLYPNSNTVDLAHTYNRSGTIVSQFTGLSGLDPDTAYYFVLKDDSGISQRYWFRTAPATPKAFSFIAGGDSRNNRTPRQRANRLVAKLRPLFVAFTGDMIDSDNTGEWNEWLDDWELTTAADGRMTPILPHRGNHENGGNSTLTHLFNAPSGNYYALNFGGSLLRYYVLNSESGESSQATWLQSDLDGAGGMNAYVHLMAGYHKPMRPHNLAKSEGSSEYNAWANLFYTNRFDLIFESDSHTMKRTQPIRPDVGAGSEEGFIEDIANGTVYIGEGCWGAPLRSSDDSKGWTAAAGSFNGFDLVHVFIDYIEVFTVQVDNEDSVGSLSSEDRLILPEQLDLWQAAGGTRLVVNRGAPTKTSFAQYQLDSFGANYPPANSGMHDDFDGDKLSNFIEFAFGLDATTQSVPTPNFPNFSFESGDARLKHHRRSDATVNFAYYLSEDLSNWTLLQEDADYTLSITPGAGTDEVELELIGDKASLDKAFVKVVAEEL